MFLRDQIGFYPKRIFPSIFLKLLMSLVDEISSYAHLCMYVYAPKLLIYVTLTFQSKSY